MRRSDPDGAVLLLLSSPRKRGSSRRTRAIPNRPIFTRHSTDERGAADLSGFRLRGDDRGLARVNTCVVIPSSPPSQAPERRGLASAGCAGQKKALHVHLPSRHEPRGRRSHRSCPAKSGRVQRSFRGPFLCLVLAWPGLQQPQRAGPGHRARVAGLCGRAPSSCRCSP
jgi:hypothetical protein